MLEALTTEQCRAHLASGGVGRFLFVEPRGGCITANTAGKPIRAVRGVGDPWAIAITPDGKTVYVGACGTDTVMPINTATNKAGKRINVDGSATFIAMTAEREYRLRRY